MKLISCVAGCFVLLAVAACGDDEVLPERELGADAGPDVREGCAADPPLDSVDLAGIWHLDVAFEFGSYGVAMRYDGDAEAGYTALFSGVATDSVDVTSSDVVVRMQWMEGEDVRVRTIDACRVRDDGSLSGFYESCRNDDCTPATFVAYPVRPLDEPVAEAMTLVGSIGFGDDISVNVRVHAGRAYVVRFTDGLRIVDVSDPAAPVHLGHSPTALEEERYNDVKLLDAGGRTYALVASNLRGIVAVDVTDPAAPTEVSTFPLPFGSDDEVNVHTLFLEGTRAYLGNLSSAGLSIYDVANPASPVLLGGYVLPTVELRGGFVHDLFVENGRVYLNYWNNGMVAVDTLDDPANPAVVGVFDTYPRRTSHSSWATTAGGRKIALHGDEDFDAHLRIVDVDEGSGDFMTEIGAYRTRKQVSIHNVMAVGEVGLITYYQDGLRVLDLADPEQPVEIAHYASWGGVAEDNGVSMFEGAIGVDYDNATDLIYLADTHQGLLILRLDR